MQLRTLLIFTVGILTLSSGCTSITDISDESPYQEMIGQCYVLQQDMHIQETCWEVGDLVLSTGETAFCLQESKSEISKGTEVTIIAIKDRYKWGTGSCPQLVLDIPGIEIPGREVSFPVCASLYERSWGTEIYWRQGYEIRLKEGYIKPCE